MSKGRNRTVYRRSDGLWVHEFDDSQQPPRLLRTQREAVEQAKWELMAEGGGTLTIVRESVTGRGKDTTSPGNDPSPTRDTEH